MLTCPHFRVPDEASEFVVAFDTAPVNVVVHAAQSPARVKFILTGCGIVWSVFWNLSKFHDSSNNRGSQTESGVLQAIVIRIHKYFSETALQN